MAKQRPKGSLTLEDAVRKVLLGGVGGANLQDRALGYGRPKHGALVGKQNAVYADVVINDVTDLAGVEVPHNLGSVPVLCQLVQWENAADATLAFVANQVNQHKWTSSTCVVRVTRVDGGAGSIDGTRLTFMVGGE